MGYRQPRCFHDVHGGRKEYPTRHHTGFEIFVVV